MKYRLFGRSGLRVSELCLGTMTFGEEFNWGNNKSESHKVFNTFLEAGGNFLDTANYYTRGTSESILGEFIAPVRDKVVIATKYSLTTDPSNPNAQGNHKKNMVQSLNQSLKRLKTDYIDLYWIHAWDFSTPEDEVLRALDDLVRAGKILHIGISNAPAWVIARSNAIAELKNWTCFTGLQAEYNLLERSVERDLIPMAEALNIGITAWSPLGMGVLTGKYLEQTAAASRFGINPALGNEVITPRNQEIAKIVVLIAKELNRPAAQIALRWLIQKKGAVIPIVGAKTAEQLKENLSCIHFELTTNHMKMLDEISKIELGYPHDFLRKEGIRKLLHSDIVK